MANPILSLQKLGIFFRSEEGAPLYAVRNLSFSLKKGAIFCLVGESGCGKSLTAKACLSLLPTGASSSGSIFFQGQDLLALPEKEVAGLRGRKLAMIFQEPMTALNPVLTAGFQAAEPLTTHLKLSKEEAKKRVIELFQRVGIPSPEERYAAYPHELSGGMRQRVMIAMALSCEPEILLADEPTTALDPTIQQQILHLIREQSLRHGMSVLFITHDLGITARIADELGVMYAGSLVETGSAKTILSSPLHPYTKGLLASAPSKDSLQLKRLPTIPGTVPALGAMPSGCPFHPRCPEAKLLCKQVMPEAKERDGRLVYCHRFI